jgi:hypothetical protein
MLFLSLFYDFIQDFTVPNIERSCVRIITVPAVDMHLQDIFISCVIHLFYFSYIFIFS